MPEKSITCPSGLSGRVRGLKGREMNLLGNRKAAKTGELFDNLLNACWLQTDDAGPYELNDRGNPNWLDVLVADRLYILIQIRQATYPNDPYSFKVTCPNRACEETFSWEIDFDDLPVKPVPEDSLVKFKAGAPVTAEIDGKTISYRLTTGKDERKAAKFLRGQEQRLLDLLSLRIVEIEGIDTNRKRAWLEELELSKYRDMLDAFDEQDGGLETTIEIECTHCGNTFEVDLPFGAEFFLPRRHSKNS